jgi:WD40 repeat protein
VRLWDVANPNRPRLLTRLTGYAGSVNAVAFAPNGRSLATGSRDGKVILWDLTKLNDLRDRPLQHACTLAGRGLSRDEWARYVAGLPYQNICPP